MTPVALPLSVYKRPSLYIWRCQCGFREVVRLFLRPAISARTCPQCKRGTAHLSDEVIVVSKPERTR